MNLIEFQGKSLYKEFNIPTTNFVFLEIGLNQENFLEKIKTLNSEEVVLKIQTLSGKRGKRGGVKILPKSESFAAYEELSKLELGEEIFGIIAEEKISIKTEYYLSLTLDRSKRAITCIFSKEGGMDIEEVAKEKIYTETFENIDYAKALEGTENTAEIEKIIKDLYRLMQEKDTLLVEINPLVITEEGKVLAADSKVTIDDNAVFRQKIENFSSKSKDTEIEQMAHKQDIAFVELDGEIGIIGNGAGLVMATLDYVKLVVGSTPANFLDIGGGASVEKIKQSLEIVKSINPKLIWINIFAGITSCLNVAKGVIEFKEENPDYDREIVVRVIGTEEAEGQELLTKHGIKFFRSMDDAAQEIKKLI